VLTPDFRKSHGNIDALVTPKKRKVLEPGSRHQVPVVDEYIYARLHAR